MRGARAAAGEASAAAQRARARERLVTAALELVKRDARGATSALREARQILEDGEGEARDRTTMAD